MFLGALEYNNAILLIVMFLKSKINHNIFLILYYNVNKIEEYFIIITYKYD